MPDSQDYHLIDASVTHPNHSCAVKDRRRPGRIQNISPALILLLRNAAEAAIPDESQAIEYSDLRALPIGAVFAISPWWELTTISIVIAAAIRFIAGHSSWIAFFGGVIL